MGRPREFDLEKAIGTATDLFWRNGYERTSLVDLTKAIGITPPSFYFAFESKEGLFQKVLDHYRSTHLSYAEDALRQPTARAVVEYFLYRKADAHTDPAHPPGCLAVNCALPCSNDADSVRDLLARLRDAGRAKLRNRFDEAKRAHDLPADCDPDKLTRYILTVGWGMAVDAKAGATRKQLYDTVDMALKAWPI